VLDVAALQEGGSEGDAHPARSDDRDTFVQGSLATRTPR